MIEYQYNVPLDPADVVRVLKASGITRPTGDIDRIARMYATSNLLLSAWSDGALVGVCRGLTDYSYVCYLADLAVARDFQKQGIGRQLIQNARDALGEGVSIILLSAPGAMTYYPKVGFEKIGNGFMIARKH